MNFRRRFEKLDPLTFQAWPDVKRQLELLFMLIEQGTWTSETKAKLHAEAEKLLHMAEKVSDGWEVIRDFEQNNTNYHFNPKPV